MSLKNSFEILRSEKPAIITRTQNYIVSRMEERHTICKISLINVSTEHRFTGCKKQNTLVSQLKLNK